MINLYIDFPIAGDVQRSCEVDSINLKLNTVDRFTCYKIAWSQGRLLEPGCFLLGVRMVACSPGILLLTLVKMPSSAHVHGLIISLICLSILLPNVNQGNVGAASMQMMMNESRRKLGSFQICALCTCCGGAKGICLPSPCCYAINCNIPNRPFGFCSFTPKTCNCFECHL
ncbi:hypothetical protein VNO78_34816 [Psophocarpus tetragonolobus]|uniref:DUF7866 domain-containing protein n=1 Tax=Psophocarpus tetragonolobus TaxID=3891 RepID=A0AAN9NNE9_PSOTE